MTCHGALIWSGDNIVSARLYDELKVVVPRHLAYVRCKLVDDDGYPRLALAFRRDRTSGELFSIECLLTSCGEGGKGGAFWCNGWRDISGVNPLDAAQVALMCANAPRCAGVRQ